MRELVDVALSDADEDAVTVPDAVAVCDDVTVLLCELV